MALTQEFIKRFFYYDPETGYFYRLNENSRNAQDGYLHQNGMIEMVVNDKSIQVQQLAWLYVHGYIPKKIIHKNGIITDNSWKNISR